MSMCLLWHVNKVTVSFGSEFMEVAVPLDEIIKMPRPGEREKWLPCVLWTELKFKLLYFLGVWFYVHLP